MSTAERPLRDVPADVWRRKLGERVKWAREQEKLSHDRLIERLGRSNRGHLIKIEKGSHSPRQDLRDDLADALNVPRELFSDDIGEAAPVGGRFRDLSRPDGGADGAAEAGTEARTTSGDVAA